MTWISICTGKSGFAASSTAEDVTKGVDGTGLTAIVTGNLTSNAWVWLYSCPLFTIYDIASPESYVFYDCSVIGLNQPFGKK